jgi:glycosyltransferase involved in cell wall biosynthesis
MKILVNTPNVNLIGGVSQIYKVLKLDELDSVDYFEIISNANEAKINKLIRLSFKYILFIFKVGKYDIIHLNPSFLKNSFYRDALYCFIANLFAKKVIIFWHGWEEDFENDVKKSSFKQWILRNIFGKARKTFVLGEIFKEKLINFGLVNTNYELITSIADDSNIENFDIEKKFFNLKNKKQIDFLFLSRIVKEKGIFIAVDTINEINKRYFNIAILHIAGTGETLTEVKNYVNDNNISNIIFHGFISGQEKFDLLVNCDICFFPTYYGEGLPNTILESMLYAQPIISRVNAGITDHIINKENGFITEKKDMKNFLAYVEYFIKDKNEIERMGRVNNIKAKSSYTAKKVKEKILNLYKEVYKNG